MTNTEIAHRDDYLACRRARGNLALRECNRAPAHSERAWSWSFAPTAARPPACTPPAAPAA